MTDSSATVPTPGLPLVAIVTPVYNGARHLEAAMQCVQRQCYPNLVHVVLDNASTDDTPAIIAAFRDARVPVLSFRNDALLPLQDNWNKAFSHLPADAVYAKLLCADDLIRSDCIERFVALAESGPSIEIVLCDDVFDDEVRRANLPGKGPVLPGIAVARSILDHSVQWLPYQHLFVRLHDEDRGESFFGHELNPDPVAVLRSALRGNFGYLHEPLVYTRWHKDSQTSRNIKVRDAQAWCYILRLIELFGEQCFNSDELHHALDRNVGRQARFVLRWLIRGEFHAAWLLHDQLGLHGAHLNPLHYLRYALQWPSYARLKRSWQMPAGPHIDEPAFINAPGKHDAHAIS